MRQTLFLLATKMKSWFVVTRSVFTHPLFVGPAYSKRDAWLYMVAQAGWSGKNIGILSCSESELANVFKWSKSNVHRFLKMLQSHAMIEPANEPKLNQQRSNLRTSWKIVNYQEYQSVEPCCEVPCEPPGEPAVIKKRTSKRTSSINKDLNTNTTQTNIIIPLPPFLDDVEFQSALHDWFVYKQEQFKFHYKPVALKGLFAEFEKLGAERSIATIRHTIKNTWRGLVEPTNGNYSTYSKPRSNAEMSSLLTEELLKRGL